MKENEQSRKSIWIIIVSFTVILIVILVTAAVTRSHNSSSSIETSSSVPVPGPEDELPQGLITGAAPSMPDVADADGKVSSFSDILNRGQEKSASWIVLFDSKSSESNDMLSSAAEMKSLADENGIHLIFLFSQHDKSNISSGSFSGAASIPLYFDKDGTAASSWQIQKYPSSIIMDSSGKVLAYSAGAMDTGECSGLIDKALNGASASLITFINKNMLSPEGGMYTGTIRQGDSVPSGHDVLSESQGLLMQYAVLSDNRSVFDTVWSYTKNSMRKDGLFAWYVTEGGSAADSDALLDDLRIYDALYDASNLWNDVSLSDEASDIRTAVSKYCIRDDGTPGSFINFSGKTLSDTISLCYLDLTSISSMAAYDSRFDSICQKSESILSGGLIDPAFPLYFGNYNTRTGKYGQDDLNTAEALYTLWNLAKAGKLPDESYKWLSDRVNNGDLYAGYKVNGSVPEGYDYHSSAVYGLAALIAGEKGDAALHEKALQRMERYRILDMDSEDYGCFGSEGENIASFDQCIPLIVYVTALTDPE